MEHSKKETYPKIKPIIKRIKEHFLAANNRELAEKWGLSQGTIDTWKNKDRIPDGRLIILAREEKISLSWLINGEGEKFMNDTKGSFLGEMGIIIPNFIVYDYMKYMSGTELKCYLLLVGNTTGWEKNQKSLDMSYFKDISTFNSLETALVALEKKNLILIDRNSVPCRYSLIMES